MLTKTEGKKIKDAAREYAIAEGVCGQGPHIVSRQENVRRLCLAFHTSVDELTEK